MTATATLSMAYHAKTAFLLTSHNFKDIVATAVLFGALHGRVAASLPMSSSLSRTQLIVI